MSKGWTILFILLLILAIYLNFFSKDIKQYDGQAEQRREYKRTHNK